jgi:hypothetical protein
VTAHSEWEALAAGHAFNALEPEDEQAFVGHLAGCDRCRRDLESYQGVGAGMAYGAEAAAPPADLKRRILDAAAAERPASFPATAPVRRMPGQRREGREGRTWQPTFRLASLATAAASVLVIALVGWNVMLRADNVTSRVALARRNAALRCLTAAGTARATLAADTERRGTACVGDGKAYVFVDRLAPNDPSHVYVLWWQDTSMGLHAVAPFEVTESGTGLFELPITAKPAEIRAVAISREPGGTMPKAPTDQVAFGSVSA